MTDAAGSSSRLIYVATDLIMPLIAGYILHRQRLLSDQAANRLIRFNVVGVYTLLTLLSFWVLPLTWDLAWLIPYGMLFILVPGALSALTLARRHKNLLNRGAYMMSAMISNVGTLGGVCAFILYSEIGFAYSQIIASCQNFLLVLLCFPLAQYYRDKHLAASHAGSGKLNWRQMFISWNQMSLVGMAAGLALNAGGIPRPEAATVFFHGLVHFGAWTALLPVGFLMNFSRMRFYCGRVWDLTVLRFAIMPAFIWFTSRLLFSDPTLLNTLLICAAAPTAINAVLASRLYKLNVNLATTSFFITTALFLFAIFPVMFFLLRRG